METCNPAREVEAGQQKGGHYYCSNCGCHATRANEMDYALNCPLVSFQDRVHVNIIMKPGTISRSNTLKLKPKPINSLSRQQLEQELGAIGTYMYSIHRKDQARSSLLVQTPHKPLKDLHLDNYEILSTEPLHDIGHHIENIFTELPHHLKDEEKKAVEDSVRNHVPNSGKESKRGVDYQAVLIKIMYSIYIPTVSEIQRVLYSTNEKRTPNIILRYYNIITGTMIFF